VIIGSGPLEGELRALVTKTGLADRVLLTGDRLDIPDIMADFDIFALLSRWEGLPLTIIEAMLAGLPVVASDVGGVKELVRDGETGLLIPVLDEHLAAAAFARLLSAPVLAKAMGRYGRENAIASFSSRRMVQEYDTLYRRLYSDAPEIMEGP